MDTINLLASPQHVIELWASFVQPTTTINSDPDILIELTASIPKLASGEY